jgi:hypothetical protein
LGFNEKSKPPPKLALGQFYLLALERGDAPAVLKPIAKAQGAEHAIALQKDCGAGALLDKRPHLLAKHKTNIGFGRWRRRWWWRRRRWWRV